MSDPSYICIGDVVSLHGVQGEVKLHVVADSPDFVQQLGRVFVGEDKTEEPVLSCKIQKNCALLKLSGITTPETARLLIGKPLYFLRGDVVLPKERFFIADILGFRVQDKNTHKVYGVLCDVQNHGAGDIYIVKSDCDKEFLYPTKGPFAPEIDFEDKTVFVFPIDGMF